MFETKNNKLLIAQLAQIEKNNKEVIKEEFAKLGALITNVLKTSGTTAGLVLLPTAEAAADAGGSGDTVENERNARGAKRENQYC